ncbi:hypothetical protein WA026_000318 [Henosepilachna vigintioctopunctata]|uniref:Major facilitator superfamily (MFS) profile domain-containing protein n=1 Tax=Henosepilachna vigintioctopunctata TaxID=420089 RepID=A0AAW1UX64_9CUCU
MAITSDIIVPIANHVGPEGVFTMRFIVGIMAGLQHPGMHKLVNNWSPRRRKGRFMSCYMGNAFGSILTIPVTSLIIEELGWSWSFYYLTIVAVLFCAAFFLLVADEPSNHRWIRQEDLEITDTPQEETMNTSSEKGKPPYWSMIASSSFWAVVVAHFGNQFNLHLTLTTVPQFLKRKLQFSLKKTAGVAALLHLAGFLLGCPYGVIHNWLLKRGASKKICGTLFTFVPHMLTGFILMYFPKIGDSAVYSVWFLVVMMLFNGVAVASVLANPEDLTTNWQETIYNTMNFFGNCGGFIGPILVSKLTEENTNEGWGLVFFTGGLLSILTGIFFRYFAEFETQDWNEHRRNAQNN